MKVFILQISENDAVFSPDHCYNLSVEAETLKEALASMLKQYSILKHYMDDVEYEEVESLDDLAGFNYQLITHDLESHTLNIKSNF